MRFYFKHGDTKELLIVQLKNETGKVIDLTGCSVKLIVSDITQSSVILNEIVSISDPANGMVEFSIGSSILWYGSYKAEFEITYTDSKVEFYPKTDYFLIDILPNLKDKIGDTPLFPPIPNESGLLVFDTLLQLQTAYPNGINQPVWIVSENSFYYWEGTTPTEPTNPTDTTPPLITANPSSGTYSVSQNVVLTSNETATIYYTTDGTTPTTSSAVYSSPIPINTTTTLKYFGKDTTGNAGAIQTATYTINAVGSTVISDNFNRSDSASLGVAPTGQTWSGGLQIISNQAGSVSNLTGASAWNTIETAKSDNIEISLDITIGSTYSSLIAGIVFRYKDASNMYAFGTKSDGSIGIYQAGATGVTIPSNKNLTMTGTHTLKVKLMGQTVECYVDDVLQFTILDTAHTTGTKHGIALYSATIPKFDNFLIKTI